MLCPFLLFSLFMFLHVAVFGVCMHVFCGDDKLCLDNNHFSQNLMCMCVGIGIKHDLCVYVMDMF